MKIQTFVWKNHEIELTYNKGKMAYSFVDNGNTYGISVTLKSKSIEDIIAATFQLIQNAIETLETLK